MLLGRHLEASVDRLLRPIDAETPEGGALMLGTSPNGFDATPWANEIEAGDEVTLKNLEELSDLEKSVRNYAVRRNALNEASKDYHDRLAVVGTEELAAFPPLLGLDRVATVCPDEIRRALDQILAAKDPRALRQVRNLALAVALAAAPLDPDRVAEAFRRFRDVHPHLSVLISPENISLYNHLLFCTPEHPKLDALKAEVFPTVLTDQEIEAGVRAAEIAEVGAWLDRLVGSLIGSTFAPDIAVGLALTHFRSPSPASEDRLSKASLAPGFLNDLLAWARRTHTRAVFARQWFDLAYAATAPEDFWRCAGVADCGFRRFRHPIPI